PRQSQYPGNGANRDALNQNLSLSYTRNFTASLINEIRAGITRFNVKDTAQDRRFDATSVGLPNAAMQTTLLNGLDAQYSGASLGTGGAYDSWSAGFGPMSPTLDYLFPFARLGAPFGAPTRRVDTNLS